MNDLIKKTIMSQYANSPRLMYIIESFTDAIDPSQFTQDFFDVVMNLNTAQGFGLDIWGRIVGIPRAVSYPNPEGEYFGFEDGFYPFGDRPFYSNVGGNSAWELGDDAYRQIILVKAFANIIYATAPNINKLIKMIFKGKGYYQIIGDMQANYVFEYILTPFERFLLTETTLMPRPCGVLVGIQEVDVDNYFGFYGSGFKPFDQGVFA